MDKPHLSAELINHIEGEILPRYEAFDKAHDRRHAFMVISNSLKLAQHYDVDMQMVYTIAAYHDLGLEALMLHRMPRSPIPLQQDFDIFRGGP